MDITIVDNKLKDAVISYAENCSWGAGKELARLMREDGFKEWERVFAACENGEIAGFCTLTERDEMPPEYPFTPFIGFVFVAEKHTAQESRSAHSRSARGLHQRGQIDHYEPAVQK